MIVDPAANLAVVCANCHRYDLYREIFDSVVGRVKTTVQRKSFMKRKTAMDRLTREQRHKNMSNIRSKDTGIEVELRKALWHKGYRYRKNYKELPGKPDIVLIKYRIAIFCDSEFFHGKDWVDGLEPQLRRGSNSEFWIKKITRNMERDVEVNKKLECFGWTVIRFWGKDIKKDTGGCVKIIEEHIQGKNLSDSKIKQ